MIWGSNGNHIIGFSKKHLAGGSVHIAPWQTIFLVKNTQLLKKKYIVIGSVFPECFILFAHKHQ